MSFYSLENLCSDLREFKVTSKHAHAATFICHYNQENGNTSATSEACLWFNKINVSNEYSDSMGRNVVWMHLLSHPFMHFTSSNVRQVVCVKGNFPSLQSVCMDLEYQLDVYRVTNNAHIKHLKVVK
jgi:hypothetical protein